MRSWSGRSICPRIASSSVNLLSYCYRLDFERRYVLGGTAQPSRAPAWRGVMGYSGAYVFGDSLVDAGNALKLAKFYGTLTFSDLPEGAPSAELGYFQGRFSNGYTFADLISNKTIGVVTQPVFP